MTSLLRSLIKKYNFVIILTTLVSMGANALCTGYVTTSVFTPALVKINKNTPVGQVVSSAIATLTTNCTSAGGNGIQWIFNYTPQSPLVSTSIGQGVFATGMPGLGYRMYDSAGNLMRPTSYGTNGGANFGTHGTGGGSSVPLNVNATFTFRIELVRTDVSLTSGTFSSSLFRFGYQYGGGQAGGCPNSDCSSQFGSQITSPVTFQFVTPMCTVAADSQTLTVKLPTITNPEMNKSVGTTAGSTDFNLNLIDCVAQSAVTMTMNGTTNKQSSVLKNGGSATGVDVQILKNGSPMIINSAIIDGNTGSNSTYTIPFTARYYQSDAVTNPGSVSATSTITLTYN